MGNVEFDAAIKGLTEFVELIEDAGEESVEMTAIPTLTNRSVEVVFEVFLEGISASFKKYDKRIKETDIKIDKIFKKYGFSREDGDIVIIPERLCPDLSEALIKNPIKGVCISPLVFEVAFIRSSMTLTTKEK